MNKLSALSQSVLAACLTTLAACGGGGGGSSPGEGSGSTISPPSGLNITADKSELRFVTLGNASSSEETITFSLNSAQSAGTYYATVEPDGKATFDAYVVDTSLTSMKVRLRGISASANFDGAVNFKLCKDEKCASAVWSQSIPYHFRTYTVDPTPVKLTGFQGATNTATRTITPAPAQGDLTISASSGTSPNWLSASLDANGVITVTAAGTGLPAGNYSGSVYLSPRNSFGTSTRIPVEISLGEGMAVAASNSVVFGSTSARVMEGSVALGFNGNQAPNWSAYSDQPWLTLKSSGGTGPAQVGYTIDTTKLADLPNFSTATANVMFSATGMHTTVHKVVVDKKLPEILALTPNPVQAGKATELRIRGRGLQQLSGVSSIWFNSAPVASGSIVSDTEAVIQLSALNAGNYAFSIPVAAGAGLPQPSLAVAPAATLSSAMIDSAGTKGALVYNAATKTLYTADSTNGKLLKYRLGAAGWALETSVVAENSTRIGLSKDGKVLYTTTPRILEERDPETLAVKASYTAPNTSDSVLYDFRNAELPITNDGRIWFARDQWSALMYFDAATKKFDGAAIEGRNDRLLYSPSYAVSQDGSSLFANTQPLSGGWDDAFRYNTATGTFATSSNAPSFGNVGTVLSGDGKYVLIGATKLYEVANYRLVGQLPATSGGNYQAAMLSPDGSRIFTAEYKYEFNIFTMVRLDVIDAASMTKVGEIPLPVGVHECGTDTYNCDYRGVFKMSPFGDAIFWAGNKKIAVIPVPPTLRQSGARFMMKRN